MLEMDEIKEIFEEYSLDELEQDKTKLIHDFDEISKFIVLMDEINLNDVNSQKFTENSYIHAPPFQWDIKEELDDYLFYGEYLKAYETLKKEIGIYKPYGFIPLYLLKKINYLKTFSLRLKKSIPVELGYITFALGLKYMECGKFEKAISSFLETINIYNFPSIMPYHYLAKIYHYQKEFKLELDVLIEVIDKIRDGFYFEDPIYLEKYIISNLENVDYYFQYGTFKIDHLPQDPKVITKQVKHAKKVLNSGNTDEGIKLLEKIIKNGTYTNTAYFTLYKKYIELGEWDCAIKICDKAIHEMGVFSQDRIEKYTKYKDKAIKLSKN